MFFLLLVFSLLAWEAAVGLTDGAVPAVVGDVAPLFQLTQQDYWENSVNPASMPCEELRNTTWTNIRLSNYSLRTFPACLPSDLAALDLSTNLLSALRGAEIVNLPKLHTLSLRHNDIQEVTWGTETLTSLQFLDLSANKLSSVPSCQAAHLPNLKWLSLAGNPIARIQPLAFSCFPLLQFLNLSATLLGHQQGGGISSSAFAMKVLPGDTERRARNAIDVLDLSGTFLEKIQQEWAHDLASLRSLHLARMARLKSLETDVFKFMPRLRELNCQDSHALRSVKTEIFDDAPHLTFLIFQNCSLSNFNPWNINSSGSIVINLYGNPLECSCRLSWLLSDPERVVLQRASDTICNTAPEDREGSLSSPSLSLLQLYDECRARGNAPILTSKAPPLREDSSSLSTGNPTTVAAMMDSTIFPKKPYSNSVTPQTTSMTHRIPMKSPATSKDVFSQSTNDPSTGETAATSSTIQRELYSASYTQQSARSLDPLKRKAKKFTATVHQEGTFYESNSPYTELVEPIETHTLLFHSTLSPFQRDQQNPTKGNPIPNPRHAVTPLYADDYDYEDPPKGTPAQPIHVLCGYDPCRHLQKPCSELQKLSPCLCPGVSGEDIVPDPPKQVEASEVTNTSAQIHWCAPSSVVRTYQLAYYTKGSERSQILVDEIYPTARQYTLYKLSPGTTYWVCVMASNKAGSSRIASEISSNSCTQFTTKHSYTPVVVVLSLMTGLFLITTIVLSVCLHWKGKKPPAEQYDTHLVSYKNPAFDNPVKLQTCN